MLASYYFYYYDIIQFILSDEGAKYLSDRDKKNVSVKKNVSNNKHDVSLTKASTTTQTMSHVSVTKNARPKRQ